MINNLGNNELMVLKPDGLIEIVYIENVDNAFKQIQELVGGLVELVRYGSIDHNSYDISVNEEGLVIGLKPNLTAWQLLKIKVCGNVVISRKGVIR